MKENGMIEVETREIWNKEIENGFVFVIFDHKTIEKPHNAWGGLLRGNDFEWNTSIADRGRDHQYLIKK